MEVFKPLTIAILSTGDELVEPGSTLQEGKIYNSNRYLLRGFLNSLNFNVLDLGVIPDCLESTLSALQEAAASADVVITTGGASVGEEDYIQTAISTLGKVDFWKVAIKPGKPVMLGQINNTTVLGLPGNPGAVFVTFMILARPFLLHKQGLNSTEARPYSLAINFDIKKEGILLYHDEDCQLAEPKELTSEEKRKIAQKHFDIWFKKGDEFFEFSIKLSMPHTVLD